ncbi:MAG: hypothetical protein KGL39_35920 [Patescibacteria group bacterium]|nr:hypothetical protein [Patescibacteria group bacterium]
MNDPVPSFRDGDLVWYEPRPGHRFAAVVYGDPWQFRGACICTIQGLGSDYEAFSVGRPRIDGGVSVRYLSPRIPEQPIPKPERPKPMSSESLEIEWTVQKIEDVIGAVAITLAPKSGDDRHQITFDVSKEQATQYAVGGKHTITIGSRNRFWWEPSSEPETEFEP